MTNKNHELQKNAVVVIAYKETPSSSEISSFKQCLKILSQHHIILVFPSKLDISRYEDIAAKCNVTLLLAPFPDNNFKSVRTYSRLLLTTEFYERFLEYGYILIYQLDAWVFRDELEYWSQIGYDYIGAPFFVGHGLSRPDSPFLPYAGNGGFSLRCVASFINLLKKKVPYQHAISHSKDEKISEHPKDVFLNISVMSLFMDIPINEDLFFAEYGPQLDSNFKVAPPTKALAFSFEIQPSVLFAMNNFKLPFGCHAYKVYDWDFWKDKISLTD